jgi:hypothetical protein
MLFTGTNQNYKDDQHSSGSSDGVTTADSPIQGDIQSGSGNHLTSTEDSSGSSDEATFSQNMQDHQTHQSDEITTLLQRQHQELTSTLQEMPAESTESAGSQDSSGSLRRDEMSF